MKTYSTDGKEIANNIRAERSRCDLKQSEVAQKISVTERTYITYEEDARNIKSTDLANLANLFGCTIDDFYVLSKSTKRELSESS